MLKGRRPKYSCVIMNAAQPVAYKDQMNQKRELDSDHLDTHRSIPYSFKILLKLPQSHFTAIPPYIPSKVVLSFALGVLLPLFSGPLAAQIQCYEHTSSKIRSRPRVLSSHSYRRLFDLICKQLSSTTFGGSRFCGLLTGQR